MRYNKAQAPDALAWGQRSYFFNRILRAHNTVFPAGSAAERLMTGGPRIHMQDPSVGKPAPKSAKKSQHTGEQIGTPIFRQNRFPVTWMSVLGPKHTFLLVARLLESNKILVKPKERKAGGGEGEAEMQLLGARHKLNHPHSL